MSPDVLAHWLAGFRVAVPAAVAGESLAPLLADGRVVAEADRVRANPLLVPATPPDASHRAALEPHLGRVPPDAPLALEAMRLDYALGRSPDPTRLDAMVVAAIFRGSTQVVADHWTTWGLVPWLLPVARSRVLRLLVDAGHLDRVEPLLTVGEVELRARALVRAGRSEQALELLARHPDDGCRRVRARALLNLGRPVDAGGTLGAVPDDDLLAEVEDDELRALIATELGVEDAAELLPHDRRGNVWAALHLALIRARIALRLGHLREARAVLDRVERTLVDHPAPAIRANAAFVGALVAFYEGRHGQLVAELQRLEDLGFLSTSTVWQHAAAVAALARSDWDEATRLIDRIAEVNPYGVVNMRAWIALQTGEPQQALDLLDHVTGESQLYQEELTWLRRLARHRLGRAVDEVPAASCITVRVVDQLLDAERALDRGDAGTARALTEAAARLVEQHGIGVRWPAIHLLRADIAARSGDRDTAAIELALADRTLPHPDGPDAAEIARARRRLAGEQGSDRRWTPPADALRVAADGSWFALPGEAPIDLGRRRIHRRLLAALAEARLARRPMDHAALVAAGWPGEKILPDAAANRLHVALAALRRDGLADWLVATPQGWILDPERPVTRV